MYKIYNYTITATLLESSNFGPFTGKPTNVYEERRDPDQKTETKNFIQGEELSQGEPFGTNTKSGPYTNTSA